MADSLSLAVPQKAFWDVTVVRSPAALVLAGKRIVKLNSPLLLVRSTSGREGYSEELNEHFAFLWGCSIQCKREDAILK